MWTETRLYLLYYDALMVVQTPPRPHKSAYTDREVAIFRLQHFFGCRSLQDGSKADVCLRWVMDMKLKLPALLTFGLK